MRLSVDRTIQLDRTIVVVGLLAIAGLGWLYILGRSRDMATMADIGVVMPQMSPWGLEAFSLAFLMWSVMMVAMMVPSATPMLLVFAAVNRKRLVEQIPLVQTGLFLLGYVLVWTAYSLLATLGQWGLHSAALIARGPIAVTPWVGALLLAAAGVYQFTPLKGACLSRCQSPLGFILTEWREGTAGAIIMGLRHGSFCVGCCWVLMALLFVAGVMNLLWVAAIGGFVLVEKVVSRGRAVSWLAGVILIAWAAWLLIESAQRP